MIAGDNILKLTIPVLLEYEVLPSDDVDVNDHIFMANNDAGSNMVKAWEKFNGSTCAAHKLGRCCLAFLTVPAIYKIEMKVKGMAAHFHRSTKGLSVLHTIQQRLKMAPNKPPPGNVTRSWTGAFEICRWFLHNVAPITCYDDEQPEGCADNPDGSKYKDHAFQSTDDWELLREMVEIPYGVTCSLFTTPVQQHSPYLQSNIPLCINPSCNNNTIPLAPFDLSFDLAVCHFVVGVAICEFAPGIQVPNTELGVSGHQ